MEYVDSTDELAYITSLEQQNAELLEAIQSIVDAYQTHFDVMPVAWQTYDSIAQAAIAKATGGEQ